VSAQQPIDDANVKKLVDRKLEIRTQIQQLRLESRQIDAELVRSGSRFPGLSTIIAAW